MYVMHIYFWKWSFLAQLLQKNPYFLKRKPFLYLQNGTLHFSAQALKIKELHHEKFIILLETLIKFLVFSQKKAFIMFQETEARMNFFISMDVFE